MTSMQPLRIKTITEYHRLLGFPKPEHPLVSVIDVGAVRPPVMEGPISLIFDFYCISVKRNLNTHIKYGQQDCDFDEGVLFCMAPGQVWSVEVNQEADNHPSGWMIIIHPDFLWNTTLAKTIKQYKYFDYSVSEALYLSDKEETMVTGIARNIEQEYHSNIDKFSQSVIIAQLEVILTYAERFYQRQFITRKISSNYILSRVDEILSDYFNSEALIKKETSPVVYIADLLNLSPGYLSELLKSLTGQNTQQHIHNKLIEKAKERLSCSNLSVSEIAYELGFEHLQSFSKLFKAKTNLSPLAFRASFN
jgi:AraC family transcriptional activator of pobA